MFDSPTVLIDDVLERLLQTCDRKEESGARQNSEFGQIRDVQNEISIQILFENDLREFVDEILEGDVDVTVSEAGWRGEMLVPKFQKTFFTTVQVTEIVYLKLNFKK